jgi:hypothetical protein
MLPSIRDVRTDAASCFILVTHGPKKAEQSKMPVLRLFKEAKAHEQQLPKTLFIPNGQFNTILTAEAKHGGIDCLARLGKPRTLLRAAASWPAGGESAAYSALQGRLPVNCNRSSAPMNSTVCRHTAKALFNLA